MRIVPILCRGRDSGCWVGQAHSGPWSPADSGAGRGAHRVKPAPQVSGKGVGRWPGPRSHAPGWLCPGPAGDLWETLALPPALGLAGLPCAARGAWEGGSLGGAVDGVPGPGRWAGPLCVPYQRMQALGEHRRGEQTIQSLGLSPLQSVFPAFKWPRSPGCLFLGPHGGPQQLGLGAVHQGAGCSQARGLALSSGSWPPARPDGNVCPPWRLLEPKTQLRPRLPQQI